MSSGTKAGSPAQERGGRDGGCESEGGDGGAARDLLAEKGPQPSMEHACTRYAHVSPDTRCAAERGGVLSRQIQPAVVVGCSDGPATW